MRFSIIFLLIMTFLDAQELLKKTLLERIIEPKINLESSYLSDSKVNGSDGSVAVSKNRISLNNKIVGVSYTNWSFLWNDIASLPFGDGVSAPIKQMHSFKVNANLPYKINEDWFLLTSLSASSTFEKETSNSYSMGLFGFASYKLNDDHTFQTGFFVNYHPTATLALPVLSYSYRSRKTDGLQFVLGFPRTYIGYFLNERLLLRSGIIYSQSLIKLSDESVVQSGGYIEAKDYMSNIGLEYDLGNNFKLSGDVLYSIKRDFTMYNHNSIEVQSYTIKPSIGANVKVTYIF
jgi:hypothetical protein